MHEQFRSFSASTNSPLCQPNYEHADTLGYIITLKSPTESKAVNILTILKTFAIAFFDVFYHLFFFYPSLADCRATKRLIVSRDLSEVARHFNFKSTLCARNNYQTEKFAKNKKKQPKAQAKTRHCFGFGVFLGMTTDSQQG